MHMPRFVLAAVVAALIVMSKVVAWSLLILANTRKLGNDVMKPRSTIGQPESNTKAPQKRK